MIFDGIWCSGMRTRPDVLFYGCCAKGNMKFLFGQIPRFARNDMDAGVMAGDAAMSICSLSSSSMNVVLLL